jgi:PRTRC genetic system protein E
MFQELMPFLAQRILLLTLSRVSDEQISVNIIPKRLEFDQQDNNAALTTPLSVTGTPKELDEQLPRQLVEFVETHLGLSSTLKSAKEQMEAAAKAAREAARKPTNSKSQIGSSRSTTLSAAKVQTESDTKESSIQHQPPGRPSHRQLGLGAAMARVPEACSTLKRRTTREIRSPVVLTDHPGKESSWKYIAWNENLSTTESSCRTLHQP